MIVAVGVLIAATTLVAPATPKLDPQQVPRCARLELVIGRDGFCSAVAHVRSPRLPRRSSSWSAGRSFGAPPWSRLRRTLLRSGIGRACSYLRTGERSGRANASRAVVSRVRNASGLPRFAADRERAAPRRCGGRFHRARLVKRRPSAHPLSIGCLRRHLPRRPRRLCGRPWPASPPLRDGATRDGGDVGRLALLFGSAGVDRAVELVFL